MGGVTPDAPPELGEPETRDYDVEHYVRQLRETFAARLVRAFAPDDFEALFADPDQPSLFTPDFAAMRPRLQSSGPR
jgi:hypothetical protein